MGYSQQANLLQEVLRFSVTGGCRVEACQDLQSVLYRNGESAVGWLVGLLLSCSPSAVPCCSERKYPFVRLLFSCFCGNKAECCYPSSMKYKVLVTMIIRAFKILCPGQLQKPGVAALLW
jgi:hypothetical protein